MFNKLKMKIAAKRVQNSKARRTTGRRAKRTVKSARVSFWARVRAIVAWPFRMIARAARHIWAWICNINVIALVNLALLIAIIVLCTMLIIDIMNYRRTPKIVIMDQPIVATQPVPAMAPVTRNVSNRLVPTLPTNKPINVVPAKKCAIAERQTARTDDTMFGDVIIDSRGAATMLRAGGKIRGNLYLQNMRKYTLPCGVRIDGNLFLRDVNMVQFCGEFTVTGNIYVSPKSSFGPLPRNARLGGQVIL